MVYINGKAALAKSVMDDGADDEEGVYLLPNSVRNSFDSSNGLYIITIPAEEIEKGTYGDFPLSVSFSAPRLSAGKISASASVAFGNFTWHSYHLNTEEFMAAMRRSTRYLVGTSELSNAAITCYAPGNVTATSFTVYGIAPVGEDAGGNVEVYLDGAKVATVAPDAKTGLYNVQLKLNDPYERSTHSVCAKIKLADGETTISSATSEVFYNPSMAALSEIETSMYNGDFVTQWENGEAYTGHWYYLPDVPTKYRLTFVKGDGLAQEGDVTDVYVNVPRGTQIARLKATYQGGGIWMTEEYPMGNTPPTGEWVTYRPAIPKAKVSQGDSQKLAADIDASGANENGFVESGKNASDYTLTTDDGKEVFSVSNDGSTAMFEGVQIASTASDEDKAKAQAWAEALPTDPWLAVTASTSQEELDALSEAGYISQWKLASTDGSLLEDDSEIGTPGAEGSNVVYENAASDSNIVYQRLGVLDATWDAMPDAFDAAGADAGKAASDIVMAYPYADGSGTIYERVTVTRDKFVQGICDTKIGRIYELINDASAEVTADTLSAAEADEDAKTEWLFDQVLLIASGWSSFYSDLVGVSQGVMPQDEEEASSLGGMGSMSVQSDSSDTPLRAAIMTQMWPFTKKITDYDGASPNDTQNALMNWAMNNLSSGFSDYCEIDFNPSMTARGGLVSRIRAGWGAQVYKELMEEVAKGAFSQAGGQAMEIAGIPAAVRFAVQQGANGARGAYKSITKDNARQFYADCLRFEAYQAALKYMEQHPEDSHFTLDGFPFGTSLPDPRKKQDKSEEPEKKDDKAKEQEEGNKGEGEADWPEGDGGKKKDDEPTASDDNTYNVPVPDTDQPVIDPSGHVFAGVDENRVEGAVATLFEVADNGSRIVWGASEYGQDNPYTTDGQGNYEWFVPEGKWSVTFTKPGFRPYTTGEADGIGSATTGPAGTWYMPVAPAQLDVNINLVPVAAPEIASVEWTAAGIEVLFTQVMDSTTIEDAMSLMRNGEDCDFSVACSNVACEGGFATKAVLTPASEPSSNEAYTLKVDTSACNYGGVSMQASYPASVVVTEAALEPGKLARALQQASNTLSNAKAAKAGVVVSENGSDVPTSAKWAPKSAFAALEVAIAAFNAVISDSNATSASVIEATKDLEDAMGAFQAACKSGTKTQEGGSPQGGNTGKPGVEVGKKYVAGSGAKAAYYLVKKVATKKAAGTVWYVKPKAPKKVTSVSVPATVTIKGMKYKVTGISAKAFVKCAKLTKATVGKYVTTISANAFKGRKKLTQLTVGAGVKEIGKNVCKGCAKLKKVIVMSKRLSKKSCKNLIAGSKIKTVKLKGAAKKAKKSYTKKFPKKVKVS